MSEKRRIFPNDCRDCGGEFWNSRSEVYCGVCQSKMEALKQCSGCQFWMHAGQCRRHAPYLDADQRTRWPQTHATDGCGDFKVRCD